MFEEESHGISKTDETAVGDLVFSHLLLNRTGGDIHSLQLHFRVFRCHVLTDAIYYSTHRCVMNCIAPNALNVLNASSILRTRLLQVVQIFCCIKVRNGILFLFCCTLTQHQLC